LLVSTFTGAKNLTATEVAIQEEIDRLKRSGPEADELEKAKARLTQDTAINSDPSALFFWPSVLRGADRDRRQLDFVRSYSTGYAAVTAKDVQASAQRWFDPDKCVRFRVVPK
jgi:predicted Zn-dependent peptidase